MPVRKSTKPWKACRMSLKAHHPPRRRRRMARVQRHRERPATPRTENSAAHPSGLVRVVWSEKAMRELDEILAWIADDKLSNAILVANRIAKSSTQLAATPYISRPTLKREARELAVPQTGYILTYSVSGDAIDILRIKRGARR